jgi:hypothetical protein
MTETSAPRTLPIGGVIAAVGGALAVIGSVLTWATVKSDLFGGDPVQNVKGLSGDGKITVVLGAIAMLAGVVTLVSRNPGARRALAIAAIVGGLGAAALGVFDLVDLKTNAIDDIITGLGADPNTITGEQRRQVEDAFTVTVGMGLYLTIAGGAIGLIGGIMSLRRRPDESLPLAAPPPPASGDTGTGFPASPSMPAPPPAAPPGPDEPPPAQ